MGIYLPSEETLLRVCQEACGDRPIAATSLTRVVELLLACQCRMQPAHVVITQTTIFLVPYGHLLPQLPSGWRVLFFTWSI